MKQYITLQQFNELSEENQTKLIEWFNGKDFNQRNGIITEYRHNTRWIPFINIGQIIEFLQEKDPSGYDLGIYNPNLCNALWDAVKSVLEDKP